MPKVRAFVLAVTVLLASSLLPAMSSATGSPVPADHEKLLYTLALPIPAHNGTAQEFFCALCTDPTNGKSAAGYLATVDVDPDSATYGQVIDRAPAPRIGGELHHMHINREKTRVVLYDLYASRAIIYDIATDPRHPRLLREVDLGGASRRLMGVVPGLGVAVGYGGPHESMMLDNGNFLVVMNSIYAPDRPDLHEGPPGGYIEMTPDGDVVNAFPRLAWENGKLVNHEFAGVGLFSVAYNEQFHTMAHSDFLTQRSYKCGIGTSGRPLELGNQVALWHMNTKAPERARPFQTLDLPTAGLTSPHAVQGLTDGMELFYVSSMTDGIWAVYRRPGDGAFQYKHVYSLPSSEGHFSSHIRVAPNRQTIYDTDATTDTIHVLRIADDPLQPRLLQDAPAPMIHVVKFSADGRRLYGTSGIASVVDYQFRNPAFGAAYGIRMWDVEPDGTLLPSKLFIDASKEPLAPPNGDGVMFGDFVLRENPERTH